MNTNTHRCQTHFGFAQACWTMKTMKQSDVYPLQRFSQVQTTRPEAHLCFWGVFKHPTLQALTEASDS
eukprot:1491227-Rhodomonas_salina.1